MVFLLHIFYSQKVSLLYNFDKMLLGFQVVLVFPGKDAVTVENLFDSQW
jgi:hypothetical protein